MATKEVMVSAPLIVLLYDRIFVAGSFREAWRRRWKLHVALAATWLLLGGLVASTGWNRGGASGFDVGITPWAYWLTQFEAVTRYLLAVGCSSKGAPASSRRFRAASRRSFSIGRSGSFSISAIS